MDLTPDATRRFLLGMMTPEESSNIEKEWLEKGADETVLEKLALEDTFTLAFRGIAHSAKDPAEVADLIDRLCELRADSKPTGNTPACLPTHFGVYQIRRELGRGGMGTVYEAVDTRLQRVVALKVLNPDRSSSPEARARFHNEARAAAKLESDHIVTVYDVGEWEGQLFFTMPCLKGHSLKDQIDGEPRMDWQEAVRIGRQIASGLSAAHAQGIAHRDIKPENIWLEAMDGDAQSRVRILDFGIARVAENIDGNSTREGMILGTPAFMAPEQARGERGDERSDLFSLGVILYRLVTGEMPFQGDNILAILSSLAIDVPKPAHELDGNIPTGLSDLIESLMAKDPAKRPPSAQVVVETLDSPQDRISRPSFGPSPKNRPVSRRMLMWATYLVLPSLAAGVAFYVSNGATVRVEINDPQITVTFKENDVTVRGASEREIRLRPGEHHMQVSYKDLHFETTSLVLKRGDRTTLRVDRLPDELNVIQDGKSIEHLAIQPRVSSSPWQNGPGKGIYITPNVLIEARDLPLPINGDFTLEAFVTPTMLSTKGEPQLFDVVGLCKFMINWEGKWSFYTFHDLMISPVKAQPKRRVHLAGVRTLKGKRFYVDGKQVAESQYSNLRLTPFHNIMLFGSNFEGTFEQIHISKAARYDADFTPSPNPTADEHTIALYPCDEGQGTTLHDRSKLGHHLTIYVMD